MSLKGKYTPLNLNCLSSFVHNEGLTINPNTLQTVGRFVGPDLVNGTYMPGTLLGNTVTTSTDGNPNSINTPPSPVPAPGAATLTVLNATGASGQSASYFKLTGFPNEQVAFRIDLMTAGQIFPHLSINLSNGDVDIGNSTGWSTVTLDSNGVFVWIHPLPAPGTYYATAVWGQYIHDNSNPRPNLPIITTCNNDRFFSYLGIWANIPTAIRTKLNQPIIIDGTSSDGTHGNTPTSTSTQATPTNSQTIVSTTYNFLGKLPKIFTLAFEHTYPTVNAVDMVQGTRYMIKTVGVDVVTDFTQYGSKSNKPGTEFVASINTGFGDGTMYDMSDTGAIKIATYKKLVTMGSGVCELLGNSAPNAYTRTIPILETRYGFLGQFATQAYKEFYINSGSYSDFLNTFNTCVSAKNQHNKVISSLAASQTYLDGVYSNMNDLISGDIAGVNSSTFYWGQDLIASGRVIDLASIDKFGQPDNLLRTLSANKAITKALNLALLSVGFTPTDIAGLSNGVPATNEQQKSLYAAFNLIVNDDLAQVLIPVNCNIQGLTSLSDLLDPQKLFPASFQSLTYPKYNAITLPTNSKTYFLLYKDGGVNVDDTLKLGIRLSSFLPNDLAFVCDGFSKSMMQVKNIKSMNIEKFAQVVANLENVNGLNVNGTNVPTDTTSTSRALTTVALGSGKDGKYMTKDFFGCMTNFYPFKELNDNITIINGLNLSSLTSVYDSMLTLVSGSPTDSGLNTLITQANSAIQSITSANATKVNAGVDIYNKLATSLQLEQNARDMAIPNGTDKLTTNVQEIYGFIDNLITYALDIDPEESEATLENISDTANLGGNSLIGSMRELRNANRLSLIGGDLDNDVESVSLKLKSANGLKANMPILNADGSVTSGPVTVNSGVPDTPGSMAGSSATSLIPDNLSIINLNNAVSSPILSPDTAVNDVTLCNCDCWEILKNNVTY